MGNLEWRTRCNARRRPVTHHVSRFTFHAPRPSRAFTLIELLIVIAIIAILAALTFPAVRAARISVMRSRARSEMTQLETAIERYKDKLGYYPPDNSANWALNQLYYELKGTTLTNSVYYTLDGSAQFPDNAATFTGVFGAATPVRSFMNCARPSRHSDEAPSAVSFLTELKPSQFLAVNTGGPIPPLVLGSGLEGPLMYQNNVGSKINPWRYNSSSPHFNTKSYDLWLDISAGDKINRICNWSDKPIVLTSTNYPS